MKVAPNGAYADPYKTLPVYATISPLSLNPFTGVKARIKSLIPPCLGLLEEEDINQNQLICEVNKVNNVPSLPL
jgi:hypothetical protein